MILCKEEPKTYCSTFKCHTATVVICYVPSFRFFFVYNNVINWCAKPVKPMRNRCCKSSPVLVDFASEVQTWLNRIQQKEECVEETARLVVEPSQILFVSHGEHYLIFEKPTSYITSQQNTWQETPNSVGGRKSMYQIQALVAMEQ